MIDLALKNRVDMFGEEAGGYIFRLESKLAKSEANIARRKDISMKTTAMYRRLDKHCAELESTLAAERASLARAIQQRDQFLEERKAATQDYMAERASRLQAEERLREVVVHVGSLPAGHYSAWLTWWAEANAALDKPSVSPEQEKP